jgi:mRNA interferase HigB
MDVLAKELIKAFKTANADSRVPLDNWTNLVETSSWRNPIELQSVLPSVDFVTPNYVFNIGANNYGLLSAISFRLGTVTVLKIGTHADYDRWRL